MVQCSGGKGVLNKGPKGLALRVAGQHPSTQDHLSTRTPPFSKNNPQGPVLRTCRRGYRPCARVCKRMRYRHVRVCASAV